MYSDQGTHHKPNHTNGLGDSSTQCPENKDGPGTHPIAYPFLFKIRELRGVSTQPSADSSYCFALLAEEFNKKLKISKQVKAKAKTAGIEISDALLAEWFAAVNDDPHRFARVWDCVRCLDLGEPIANPVGLIRMAFRHMRDDRGDWVFGIGARPVTNKALAWMPPIARDHDYRRRILDAGAESGTATTENHLGDLAAWSQNCPSMGDLGAAAFVGLHEALRGGQGWPYGLAESVHEELLREIRGRVDVSDIEAGIEEDYDELEPEDQERLVLEAVGKKYAVPNPKHVRARFIL